MSPRCSSWLALASGEGGSMRRSCVGVVMVTELSFAFGISVWGISVCANEQAVARASENANQERDITMTSMGRAVAGSTLAQAVVENSAADFGPYYPPLWLQKASQKTPFSSYFRPLRCCHWYQLGRLACPAEPQEGAVPGQD